MKKNNLEPRFLRGVSIVVIITFCIFVLAGFLREALQFDYPNNTAVQNAEIDLSSVNFDNDRPVALNGEWDVFPGLFMEQYQAEALTTPERHILPISHITQLKGLSSYRITIQAGTNTEHLALLLPNYRSDMAIYVNGTRQEQQSGGEGYWPLKLSGSKIFSLGLEPNTTNELVLSVGRLGETNPLHKRDVLLGSWGNVIVYSYLSMANSVFLFGLLLVLTVSAFVFVFLYPHHRVISLMTLLDSFIILHVLLGMGNVVDYVGSVLGGIYLSDSLCMSLQIFFLLIAGVFGALLAHYLFDPESQAPGYLWRPLPYIYIALSITLPFRLDWAETFGIYLMFAALLYTGVALVFQLSAYWRNNKNSYALLQIFKTGYFAIVAVLDILSIGTATNLMYFAYAYLLFLLMHLCIRLYDNRMSYAQVATLNISLEQKVEERTAELVTLNQTLSEISIRDALTKAYNRLHFERYIEKMIAEFGPDSAPMHLCMFDLDLFKQINDTFGHAAGDEQLKSVVSTVGRMVDSRTLLARIGGEEFVLVFDGHDTAQVMEKLEEIRRAFEQKAANSKGRTTASFGLVRYSLGMTQKQLLAQADRCLYRAKDEGRNRIVFE